jgi:hypothetical protein
MALIVAAGVANDRLKCEPQWALLADRFPAVRNVERMNQSVSAVRSILDGAELAVARIAIPYLLSVYSIYLADAIRLLRGMGYDDDEHDPDETHLRLLHTRFSDPARVRLETMACTGPGAPCGLVAAVEHVGDLVDPLGAWGGVAGGGAEVDVPEPGGDGVHGHAGLEAVGGPVGA